MAVLREDGGRGGSVEVHGLDVGDELVVRGPRNHFALGEAPAHLLVAGGIGIAPLLPMIDELARRDVPWQLVYRARSAAHLPFADRLRSDHGERVHLSTSDLDPRPDLDGILGAMPDRLAVHCCGPASLIDGVRQAAARTRPMADVHVERFVATERATAADEPFEVVLARSGRTVQVPAAGSMLDALRPELPDAPSSCETGLCGSCRMTVLAGRPEHRDDILGEDERERADVVYPCVSRSFDPRLVLDE